MRRFGNDPMRVDYCSDCGKFADECEKVSACCGAEEQEELVGCCAACGEHTGFECEAVTA